MEGKNIVKKTVWLWTGIGIIAGFWAGGLVGAMASGGGAGNSNAGAIIVFVCGIIGAVITGYNAYRGSMKADGGPPAWLWRSRKKPLDTPETGNVPEVKEQPESIEKTESETGKPEDDNKNKKIWFILEPLIFAYNCYAIINNLIVGDGYLWVVLGLIINIAIVFSYPVDFRKILPKLNAKFAYAVLGVALLFGIIIGSNASGNYDALEKTAQRIINKEISVHSQIKCTETKIVKKLDTNEFLASVTFDNGETNHLLIYTQEKDGETQVTVRLADILLHAKNYLNTNVFDDAEWKCEKVKILEKVGTDKYKGKCYLTKGNPIGIIISIVNGQINVELDL